MQRAVLFRLGAGPTETAPAAPISHGPATRPHNPRGRMLGFDLDALMRGVERAQIRRLQCQLVPPLIIADLRPLFEGVHIVKTRVIELLLTGDSMRPV